MLHTRFQLAMIRMALLLLLPACFARPAAGEDLPPSVVEDWDERLALFAAEEAVEFEGFGLDDFHGAGSVASALQASDLGTPTSGTPLRLLVKGPSAPDQAANPVQAEVKGRIEGVDLSAGLLADRKVIEGGPQKFVGGMSMAHDHTRGRESLELRTSIAQAPTAAKLALELGPRIERRLPGGMTLFFDGKAEAQSAPQGSTRQPLAGPMSDGIGLIGVTGRTGLMR
jgi:hypothetical protein